MKKNTVTVRRFSNPLFRLRRLSLMAMLLVAFGYTLNAQEQTGTAKLTLQEALNIALQTNIDARKAKLSIENSSYQIDEIRAMGLPQLSASGGLTHNPILMKNVLPGEFNMENPGQPMLVAFGLKWNSTAGLNLSQNLFDQSILTGLKAAKGTREFYELNGALTDEQVIEMVATGYYNVLVTKQKLGVIDTTIANTKKTEAIIRGLFESGLGKEIDVDRISVNLANLESQRTQLVNAIKLMENQLKYAIGIPVKEIIQLEDADFEDINPDVLESPESISVNNRIEYQVLKKQEELLNYQKESFKAEYYPSLSLNGNFTYQGVSNQLPWFKTPSQGANWFNYSSIGATLRVPIFNGFGTRARIRQADISIRKLQEDINLTELGLNMEYENAKLQINNSITILKNQEKNTDLAQKVYSNTQNNYNNGLALLTDLLQAENAVTEAQNNYNTALLDYKLAEIKLIKAQGNLKSLLNN